jgi:hypothetical protein
LADAGSLSGIRKTLLRLAEQGVVNLVPGGYALNREHLAAGAISQLVNLRAEFTRRLTTFVDALPESPCAGGAIRLVRSDVTAIPTAISTSSS